MKNKSRILCVLLCIGLVACMFAACTTQDNAEKTYIVLDEMLDSEQVGIGFRNDDIALGNAVIAAFQELITNGKGAEISKKWFGEDLLIKNAPALESTEVKDGDESLNKVKQAGKLIVGLDDHYPPMGFRDDKNELTGFDIEMAKAVGEVMGVTIEFQPIDWDAKEVELNSGRIDCIWNGMSIDDSRIEKMYIPCAYLDNNQIIIVPSNSTIKSIADLAGKKVGLQKGSTSYNALEKSSVFSQIKTENIIQLAENVTVFLELKAGRIDAFVVDELPGRYIMSHN